MSQIGMLPERIRRIDPNPVKSADSPGIGVAYSGQRYVLKVAHAGHPLLPASEWICHGLAFAMGLAVPHWAVCEFDDGTLAFGSRFEGDVKALQYQAHQAPQTDNPQVVSQAFMLDLFLANLDRHPGNWIETESAGVRLLRPIDYSRALLWRWPLPTPPFTQSDNSGQFYLIAMATGAMVKADALESLGFLMRLKKDVWRTIVQTTPDAWVTNQLKRELINWWWSPQWHTRIHWIRDQL
jgi:hypothetical protein